MNGAAATHRAPLIGAGLILLLALLTALDAMAIDMYLPGMPAIAGDFGVSPGRIQQTLSIFLAGLAIGQALYGPLLDRYGRRLPLLAGVAVFVAGSVMAAVAPSVEWLLAARFVQALGAAAGLVTPRAIVADLCGVAESARIFSLLMQVMMIAPIAAPILGGYLLGHGGWRGVFWVLAGLGAAGLLWGWRALPDSLPVQRRAQLNGGAILRAYGRQLRHPAFMAYTLAGGFVLGSLFNYISASAFVFTGHFGLSATQFSYVFAGNSVALVLGGMVSNRLLGQGRGAGALTLAGIGVHALAGLALFGAVLAGQAPFAVYAGLLAVAVGALGLIFGNLTALTMSHAGKQAGVASALMGTLHYLMSAAIGYAVSLAPQGPGLLPVAIFACGVLAAGLCVVAGRRR
ncbi:Bicyclomycin resistance protein [Achromobacter deleyi]|uniref:Bcr/CflA family efflux transporter n=1 Tax=Achromobacter deleyi TaxID=1353891 RepID=A0A6S7A8W2_9BURK|nr:multidrug effflux MFS transporter [Achromobacter deleyi]CAB3707499.1 Bicyclomycin resistance protein [Achromobacter deleyi]CAB3865514.1 Bicyclomycin resistance protein [Achromobacter deleyi]CAB3878700.1 Bicyclomycin resistance protein [Achromobacter deleyi]